MSQQNSQPDTYDTLNAEMTEVRRAIRAGAMNLDAAASYARVADGQVRLILGKDKHQERVARKLAEPDQFWGDAKTAARTFGALQTA